MYHVVESRHRALRSKHRRAAGLLVLGVVFALNLHCDVLGWLGGGGGDPVVSRLREALDKLPAGRTTVKSALPGTLGPEGALFGLLLENGGEAFVLGTVAGDSSMSISGVVLYDAAGEFVLRQDFADQRSRLTFATGDAVVFDLRGAYPRIVMTLDSTDPPSVIALDGKADGSVEMDPNGTYFGASLNSQYEAGAARLRRADASVAAKAAVRQAGIRCEDVGNAVVWATQLVCDLKHAITGRVPEWFREKTCAAAMAAIDLVKAAYADSPDESRIPAALKTSVTVICEGTKIAIQVGDAASRVTPLDLACLTLSLADNATATVTGTTLAEQICRIFSDAGTIGAVRLNAEAVDLFLRDPLAAELGWSAIDIDVRLNGRTIYGYFPGTGVNIRAPLAEGLNHFEFELIRTTTGNTDFPPRGSTGRVSVFYAGTNTIIGNATFELTTFGQIVTFDIVRRYP